MKGVTIMSNEYFPLNGPSWLPCSGKTFICHGEAELDFGWTHVKITENDDNTFTAYVVGRYWSNYTERKIKKGKHRRKLQALLRKLVRRLEAGADFKEALRSL